MAVEDWVMDRLRSQKPRMVRRRAWGRQSVAARMRADHLGSPRVLQLHYHPSNASMVPHLLLEELGTPYELVLVDRAHAAHKSAAYLALNPNGLIPVMVDGDLVLYETAAICLHLADTHPNAA